MSMTLERFVTAILRGESYLAQLPTPQLSPDEHRRIVDRAIAEHGTDPAAPPWDAIVDEGFTVRRVPGTPRCGFETDQALYIPWCPYDWDRRVEGMLTQHARSHGWGKRFAIVEANESDYWLLTAQFIRSANQCGNDVDGYLYAPTWFLVAANDTA